MKLPTVHLKLLLGILITSVSLPAAWAEVTCRTACTMPAMVTPILSEPVSGENLAFFIENYGKYLRAYSCDELKSVACEIGRHQTRIDERSDDDDTLLEEHLARYKKEKAALLKTANAWETEAAVFCRDVPGDPASEKDKESKLRIIDNNIQCYRHLISPLTSETEHLKKVSADSPSISVIGKELAHLQSELAEQEAKRNIVMSAFSFTREELEKVYVESNWYSIFHLGLKVMPDYDDEGNNNGFDQTSFFGRFNIDSRWDYESTLGSSQNSAINAGIQVDLLSSPVVSCSEEKSDKEGSSEENGDVEEDDSSGEQKCRNKELKNLDFNDISDALDASVYAWWQFPLVHSRSIELGLGGRLGMQSREKLADNQDSINRIRSLGLRFVYNDFKEFNAMMGSTYKNGLPRVLVEYTQSFYEDYSGLGKRKRHVVLGAYRIKPDSPVFAGVALNGGEGPDIIALTLTYGLKADAVLNLF